MGADLFLVFKFWSILFLTGAAAFPLSKKLFFSWWDRGYLFSKAVGIMTVTYLVWLGASVKILPFSRESIILSMGWLLAVGVWVNRSGKSDNKIVINTDVMSRLKSRNFWTRVVIILVLELFFLGLLLFWSWVKGHEPSIRGLEKFMDYGFTKSILNSRFFPPPDMWYSGGTINYYYFGHTVMAMLTRLSGIDLSVTFNLMLATIFALCFSMSFSIGFQISNWTNLTVRQADLNNWTNWKRNVTAVIAGVVTAFLVSLAGNMQTLYAFTMGYTGEDVKPIWTLLWKASEFWQKLPEGLERYWYANATRFIPFTIHEFPSYSFVVSDLHGHVLSIPFVLLAIALLLRLFSRQWEEITPDSKNINLKTTRARSILDNSSDWLVYGFYGLLVSVLFMTNALDGPIYLGLILVLIIFLKTNPISDFPKLWQDKLYKIGIVSVAGPAALPFILNFKSFVSGIAVNCPPEKLANTKMGLLIFEGAEKCQHSPLWMWWMLWGFFVFNGIALMFTLLKFQNLKFPPSPRLRGTGNFQQIFKLQFSKLKNMSINITQTEKVLLVFFVYSLLLLIFPEFFYFRDIYPAHFRSNTMFKLGYQAFIMLSILSGYTIIKILFGSFSIFIEKLKSSHFVLRTSRDEQNSKIKSTTQNLKVKTTIQKLKFFKAVFICLLIPQLFLVSIYPIFAVRSYFDSLRNYKSIWGLGWLQDEYPDDYAAIDWLNKNAVLYPIDQTSYQVPVITEADGDSYTDYARISAFTGLPAVIGWPVHEWLWRGSYDVVAPRRDDVRVIYESGDTNKIITTAAKYNLRFIIVGSLERQHFQALNENAIASVAQMTFSKGNTVIYQLR